MAKRGSVCQRAVLAYPSYWFVPEDWLSFIELRPFTNRWNRLQLSDMDLQTLQILIVMRPAGGTVIQDTGGVRKIRFAQPHSGKGKSGGLRVCYAYIEEVATVVLAVVYAKDEKDDLTDKEKAVLRGAVERVKAQLLSRP